MNLRIDGKLKLTITFLSFVPIEASSCGFGQFKCSNARCVADNLACDGHNNCGDNSDEECGKRRMNPHAVFTLSFFVL